MKMGISTKAFPLRYWENPLLGQDVFDTIEIDTSSNNIPYSEYVVRIVKEKLKKFDLSLHSSHGLFHENNIYADMELSRFKFHVWLANEMDINQVVFHISNEMSPKSLEKNFDEFQDIIKKNSNIQFFVENNSRGYFACEKEILWLCGKIPELRICLDVGHLNRAFYRGCIRDIKNSIISMKHKTNYLHLHDNNGEKDEHLSCGEGNIKWEELIPLLNKIRAEKTILECLDFESAEKSLKFLRDKGLKFK